MLLMLCSKLGMTTQFRTSRKFDVVFLFAVAAGLWWCTLNRVAIGDWIYFLNFQPTAEMIRMASDASLTAEGRTLLYRTDPQFTSHAVVIAHCDDESLGCLTSSGQVYIWDDPTNPKQTIVVAAHEMLHLAYRRLPSSQKSALTPLLNQAIAENAILGINGDLEQEDTPDGRLDEAHSRLGTQYQKLPSALESYYRKYFTDRTKVLAAAQP
jgi:hypothetical protein